MSIENVKFQKPQTLTDPRMTFEELSQRIQAMRLSEDLTARLLRKARAFPPGSLGYFLKNINTFIANLNKAASKVSHPTPPAKDENIEQV